MSANRDGSKITSVLYLRGGEATISRVSVEFIANDFSVLIGKSNFSLDRNNKIRSFLYSLFQIASSRMFVFFLRRKFLSMSAYV